MVGAPVLRRIPATAAWLLFMIWPFSRLVHARSIPPRYAGRPYIRYRRRRSAVRADRGSAGR